MSRKDIQAYGSDGVSEYPKLHTEGDNVLTVLDPGHFMHGRVNVARYVILNGEHGETIAARRNASLIESVRDKGVTEPGKIWAQKVGDRTILHVISGTRRTLALRVANSLRLEEGLATFTMEYKINSRWTRDQALEMWRLANQERVDNDVLTRIEGAALDVDRGISLADAAETWDFSEAQLGRALKPGGILEASQELKDALAAGLPLARALKIATQSKADQRAALLAPAAAKSKRKYMGDKQRDELRAMLTGHIAGQPMNTSRLGELLALL